MDITGKIIHKLDLVSGTSQKGNAWKKQEYVLETQDTFPKKVHFDFFGDKVDQFPLNIGDTIKLYFDIESREYNGRWYTSIHGWKTEPATVGAPMAAAPMPGAPASAAAPVAGQPVPPASDFIGGNDTDDLPF